MDPNRIWLCTSTIGRTCFYVWSVPILRPNLSLRDMIKTLELPEALPLDSMRDPKFSSSQPRGIPESNKSFGTSAFNDTL